MGHSCWQKITVPFVRLRLPNLGLCSKVEVFQSALGEECVERTEHIVVGARRCAYQVSAKVKPSK